MAKKAKKAAAKRKPIPGQAGDRALKKPEGKIRQGPKPERTASRAEASGDPEPKQFLYERLGKVQRWDVPQGPYSDNANHRVAYVGGFRTRVEQWSQGTLEQGIPDRFGANSGLQRCFEDGYNDAARQDGGNLKPRVLSGSKSAENPRASRKRG